MCLGLTIVGARYRSPAGGGLTSPQVFSTPGPYSFTAPVAGTYTFKGKGGGGGGGGGSGSNGSADGGSEAGKGELTRVLSGGETFTGTIGSPGSGGVTNGNGSNGTATTLINAVLSISATANGGIGGARAQDSGSNAPGGTASGWDANTTGAVGGAAPNGNDGGNGGGTGGGLGGIFSVSAPTDGTDGGGGGGGAQSAGHRTGALGGGASLEVSWV